MQETTVMCDVCGGVMEEPTDIELSATLIKPGDVDVEALEEVIEFNLEDICPPCSRALESAVSGVIERRSSE